MDEDALLALARCLGRAVTESLRAPVADTRTGATALKSESDHDRRACAALVAVLRDLAAPVVVMAEDEGTLYAHAQPRAVLLVDPIDGSLNWQRQVGDPGFVVAWSSAPAPCFADLTGGYVLGLRSHDEYFSARGQSFRQSQGVASPAPIRCDERVTRLADAVLYFNDGYGQGLAKTAWLRAGVLPLLVRHHNAFDNTALELCEICRGAAHLRVEARVTEVDGRKVGSEHANLLSAFAIGGPAGLVVADLQGRALEGLPIALDDKQDFICAASPDLLAETVAVLRDNRARLRAVLDEPG